MEKSLDDSSYRKILEKAMERLRSQAPWWTHREVSDPGVTLLELWALLADMQSYYLDQIQESHYRKYLKLLGIPMDEGSCARAWIFYDNVDKDRIIPPGTKLLADQMVYETEGEMELTTNSLTGFYQGDGRNQIEVMKMRRKNQFALRGEDPLFTVTLKYAVEPGETLTFFVLLNEQKKRNSVEGDFYMARLAWEYQTAEGWQEAQVDLDETKGLLYSGRIRLRVEGFMADGGNGFAIRCRIKEGCYDILPELYRIRLNVGAAVQQETLCQSEHVLLSAKHPCAVLKSYLAKTGNLRVLLRRQDEWEDITQRCRIDPPITSEMPNRFVWPEAECLDGEKAVECQIVCSAPDVDSQYRPCLITGVTSQQIVLPWEGILHGRLELMLRQKTGGNRYREYQLQEPEETSRDNGWHWCGESIVLGDGRHGDIPQEAEDGLLLTSLVLSNGGKGNVAIGKIQKWEKPELFGTVKLNNPMVGGGGKTGAKPSEQFAEAAKLLKWQNRLVTKEDIQQHAKKTPGLIIKEADVAYQNGIIKVTVFPEGSIQDKYCLEKYRSMTAKHLEQYRMAAMRIEVAVSKEGYSK